MTSDAMPTSIAEVLQAAQAIGIERLDAQTMLGAVLGRSRTWLIAHDDVVLSSAQQAAWQGLRDRRAGGEPLAYVLGEKAFHGLLLQVDSRVLIPRADTELLVDWALERLAEASSDAAPASVVDLGTGSGAIALAIKREHPRSLVTATDLSQEALAVAICNATRLALDIEFIAGSWWMPLPGRRFDLVVGNPPYIAGGDPHLAALTHEPLLALTPSGDGLDALRAIVDGAPGHLNTAGWLLLEHGHDQADAVRALLSARGFGEIETRRDLGGQARCTGGRRPASAGT
jgi:release factor glutamine methyltransferase